MNETTGAAPSINGLDNPAFCSFLNLVRWLSAFMVVAEHARHAIFVPFPQLESRGMAANLFYAFAGFGHSAVIIFFVISGYLVGGTALRNLSLGRFRMADYLLDRVTRIYVVALPVILTGYFLDQLGVRYLGDSGLYSGEHILYTIFPVAAPAASATPVVLAGNLAMLQDLFVPTVGSNTPLWSLSYEFWFYLYFAVLLGAMVTGVPALRGLLIATSVAMMAVLGARFAFLITLWALGILASQIPRPVHWKGLVPLGGLLFALALGGSRFHWTASQNVADLALAVSCALLLFAAKQTRWSGLVRSGRLNEFLASCSYTLYVVHMPLVFFVVSLAAQIGGFDGVRPGMQFSPSGLILYLATILAVLGMAGLVAFLTEHQTAKVRRWCRRRLSATRLRLPLEWRRSSPLNPDSLGNR